MLVVVPELVAADDGLAVDTVAEKGGRLGERRGKEGRRGAGVDMDVGFLDEVRFCVVSAHTRTHLASRMVWYIY